MAKTPRPPLRPTVREPTVRKPVAGKARPRGGLARKDALSARLARRDFVIRSADLAGLLAGDSTRIAARIRQALVKAAKERSGISSDTELLEYALARVALEDSFSETLTSLRGTVPPISTLRFDLAASLRLIKPEKRSGPLAQRDAAALTFVDQVAPVGPDLLLDTCVTIDTLQGRAPRSVDAIREARVIHHSAVALAELTHLFGRLDRRHPHTAAALARIGQAIAAIPRHRLAAPSVRASAEAGILAGLLVRLAGRPHDQALLNDALLHCQAIEQGHTLLTANIRDFDLFDQILPGRMLFYRC